MRIHLPFGNTFVNLDYDDQVPVDLIYPNKSSWDENGDDLIEKAVNNPLCAKSPWEDISTTDTVCITINDKTRPVPNEALLKPLLAKLSKIGIPKHKITLLVASGTHFPMPTTEYGLILPEEIIDQYQVKSHDCDDKLSLLFLGYTSRNTPIWVNKSFYEANLRIVVGDIELHHFAGFSGGVKSAAIGVCGRETINANHTLLLDQNSRVGEFENNPLRQDIEEIGSIIQVDLALNAILNEEKRIVHVFMGAPDSVMQAGIKAVRKLAEVPISGLYDLVFASAGGFPKDINLYQAQKAMTHASLFLKPGGTLLLTAECREGIGSPACMEFVAGTRNPLEVIEKFKTCGFSVGPHKAYQIARLVENYKICVYSLINPVEIQRLFLNPVASLAEWIDTSTVDLPINARIAIIPYATAMLPMIK